MFEMGNFPHLQPNSRARGMAVSDSLSDPRFQCDIDNDQRTDPADIGADEVP